MYNTPDALEWRDDVVALFPGQGSLSVGAGEPWRISSHWILVNQVSEVSGVDVEYLLTSASHDEVIRTDNAQLATFTLSMMGYGELLTRGIRPRYLLGHSLGEFSALCASGLLDIEQATRLISVRGRAMARAATQREGSMVALMGGDEGARQALSDVPDVWIANVNGPGQIVVSGTREGLEYVSAHHREWGWRRATPLPVGGAFHSPLMTSALDDLVAALSDATWGTTEHVIIANVDGEAHAEAIQWRELLAQQLTSTVEFLDATTALPASVVTSFEMPPGEVLTGLVRRIRPFNNQICLNGPEPIEVKS